MLNTLLLGAKLATWSIICLFNEFIHKSCHRPFFLILFPSASLSATVGGSASFARPYRCIYVLSHVGKTPSPRSVHHHNDPSHPSRHCMKVCQCNIGRIAMDGAAKGQANCPIPLKPRPTLAVRRTRPTSDS
jgi:hypothetical protein